MQAVPAKVFKLVERNVGGASLEIDASKYDGIKRAKDLIMLVWDIEETFTLLADSFVEFEQYLLRISASFAYEDEAVLEAEHFFSKLRQTVNLKLVTTLTAARSYEEQSYRRVSSINKITGGDLDIKPAFSAAFDGSLEYRVMYALRNHALHNELPLGLIYCGGTNQSENGNLASNAARRRRVAVDPLINCEDFLASDRIVESRKREVAELEFRHLDLKFFLRGFIANLATCHDTIRMATTQILEDGLSVLFAAHNALEEAKGEESTLAMLIKESDGSLEEETFVQYCTFAEITKSKNTYPQTHQDVWISK